MRNVRIVLATIALTIVLSINAVAAEGIMVAGLTPTPTPTPTPTNLMQPTDPAQNTQNQDELTLTETALIFLRDVLALF